MMDFLRICNKIRVSLKTTSQTALQI